MNKTGLIMCVGLASFIEMWAAATLCDNTSTYKDGCGDSYLAWAVACGTISAFVCLVLTIMSVAGCGGIVDGVVGQVIALLLFIWWFAGVGTITMESPFTKGTNGFFGTWIALIASGALVVEADPFGIASKIAGAAGGADGGQKMLLGIGLCSLILMWHSAVLCDNGQCGDYYTNAYVAWGVACGAISLFLCILFMIPAIAGFLKFGSIFFAIWWIAAMVTLTMNNSNWNKDDGHVDHAPFTTVCNGFVACWIGMFASLMLFGEHWGGSVASAAGVGGGSGGGGTTTTTTTTTTHEESAKV
jgi:hypothetical protein